MRGYHGGETKWIINARETLPAVIEDPVLKEELGSEAPGSDKYVGIGGIPIGRKRD